MTERADFDMRKVVDLNRSNAAAMFINNNFGEPMSPYVAKFSESALRAVAEGVQVVEWAEGERSQPMLTDEARANVHSVLGKLSAVPEA